MNPIHKVIFTSTCVLAGFTGLTKAWVDYRSVVRTNAQSQACSNSQAVLLTRIDRLRKECADQSVQLRKLKNTSRQEHNVASTSAAPLNSGDRFARDPALAALRKDFFSASAKLTLNRLLKKLGLTQSEAAAVYESTARFNEEAEDRANQLPGNLSGADDPRFLEFKKRGEAAWLQHETDLKSLLGNDGLRKWVEFQASRPVRLRADNLASALYATDTPLSGEQSEQLIEVMTAHFITPSGSVMKTYDIPAISQKAAAFLSPPQLSILKQQLVAAKIW